MSSRDYLSDGDSGRPLTGWKVLAIISGCFGVMLAVNGLMAYYAISTFSGETEVSPYEHGLAYQQDIDAAKAQAALGWSVAAHAARDDSGAAAVEIEVRDAAAAPVAGLAVTVRLISSANARLDTAATLAETSAGVYAGRAAAGPGQWDLEIDAVRGGARVFKSVNRIALR